MKTIHSLRNRLLTALSCLLAVAGLAACQADDIVGTGGRMPDTDGIDLNMAMLRSTGTPDRAPMAHIDHADAHDTFFMELTKPAVTPVTFGVAIDATQATLDAYNTQYNDTLELFPAANASLSTAQLSFEAGKKSSSEVTINFLYHADITPAVYLLPVTVQSAATRTSTAPATPTAAAEYKTVYYKVKVWTDTAPPDYETRAYDFFTRIVYIDTEYTNPLLIDHLFVQVTGNNPNNRRDKLRFNIRPADIVNLLTAGVKVDAAKMPYLNIASDLNYVLKNARKYISPLQQHDFKVCVSVKGGGQGIGFSNMNDLQAQSLIYEIKKLVDTYRLDGVNLFEDSFFYPKDNPASAESLFRFVQQLRTALPNTLITYALTKESPKEIDRAYNGIELGRLIDYAWANELNTVTNPWDDASAYKPIIGLSKEQWGGHVMTLRNTTSEESQLLYDWDGLKEKGIHKVFVTNAVVDMVPDRNTPNVAYDYIAAGVQYFEDPVYTDFIGSIIPQEYFNAARYDELYFWNKDW
jgi:hypothetical protein